MGMNNQVSRHAMEIDPRTKTIDYRFQIDNKDKFHPIKEYDDLLSNYNDYYNVENRWNWKLIKIDHEKQLATFQKDGNSTDIRYRYLMLNPPCKPASFIKDSGLGDEEGYLEVAPHSLQHVK